jgi:hypothetical protein
LPHGGCEVALWPAAGGLPMSAFDPSRTPLRPRTTCVLRDLEGRCASGTYLRRARLAPEHAATVGLATNDKGLHHRDDSDGGSI